MLVTLHKDICSVMRGSNRCCCYVEEVLVTPLCSEDKALKQKHDSGDAPNCQAKRDVQKLAEICRNALGLSFHARWPQLSVHELDFWTWIGPSVLPGVDSNSSLQVCVPHERLRPSGSVRPLLPRETGCLFGAAPHPHPPPPPPTLTRSHGRSFPDWPPLNVPRSAALMQAMRAEL
ncbi:hypothetical protein AAFF_G00039440 [Aldrovandia affinis]|uniref:Uncharacterized protein n=1 Tax=Aldrovandia affinis TaxID=143900 RepID=A0AAD7WFK0_9TELE|nr:hypothetical protein AAFF_G00039440 [Aldrovandia affinis]